MNVPQSDSSAAIVDFVVNGDTTFERTFVIRENDVLQDTTYWEGEFVVFYPDTCKIIYNWNTTNNKLDLISKGTYQISELIDVENDEIDKGDYEYYLLFVDGDGKRLKYTQGKFIVE